MTEYNKRPENTRNEKFSGQPSKEQTPRQDKYSTQPSSTQPHSAPRTNRENQEEKTTPAHKTGHSQSNKSEPNKAPKKF
ncbi:MAG: hypothetical protein ACHQJ6_06295 [Candidatus Berkiellales bacterium]